jgi:hypothetical protein
LPEVRWFGLAPLHLSLGLTVELEARMSWFWLLVFGIVVYAVYQSAFASGKRIGSRKGYGVGYSRGLRKSRKNEGCLVMIVAALIVVGTITVAVAG